jgi:hypothetical protein
LGGGDRQVAPALGVFMGGLPPHSLEKVRSVLKHHLTNEKIHIMTGIKKVLAEQEWTEF